MPIEWGKLLQIHLDHHLRRFAAYLCRDDASVSPGTAEKEETRPKPSFDQVFSCLLGSTRRGCSH